MVSGYTRQAFRMGRVLMPRLLRAAVQPAVPRLVLKTKSGSPDKDEDRSPQSDGLSTHTLALRQPSFKAPPATPSFIAAASGGAGVKAKVQVITPPARKAQRKRAGRDAPPPAPRQHFEVARTASLWRVAGQAARGAGLFGGSRSSRTGAELAMHPPPPLL